MKVLKQLISMYLMIKSASNLIYYVKLLMLIVVIVI